jgi:hypothetical protein
MTCAAKIIRPTFPVSATGSYAAPVFAHHVRVTVIVVGARSGGSQLFTRTTRSGPKRRNGKRVHHNPAWIRFRGHRFTVRIPPGNTPSELLKKNS